MEQQFELWMMRDLRYPPHLVGLTERTKEEGGTADRPAAGTGAEQPAAAPSAKAGEAPLAAAAGSGRADNAAAAQGAPFSAWPT
eukprot:5141330-Lingulodinium_polyedra.AAC.1